MTIAAVQRISKTFSAVSSCAIGSGDGWATPTSGNLIVLTINCDRLCSTPSGYTAGSPVEDDNAVYLFDKISAGTETAPTITPIGGTTTGVMTACEYSGVAASPFDASNTSSIVNTVGTTTTSTSVTTTAPGDLIIAVAGLAYYNNSVAAPTSPTWTNSFVNQITVDVGANTNNHANTFYAELIAGAAGSYSTSCSWTTGMLERQELVFAVKALTTDINKVADQGSTQNLTSQTSTDVTLAAGGSITTGNYLIARLALDNASSTPTAGSPVTLTVTDPRSNTWTIVGPANVDPGAANAGATCYIAYAKVVNAYSDADAITFGYTAVSVTAKAIVVQEWNNIHPTSPVAVAATTATGSSGTPSISLTPTAVGQMFYGALAIEGPSGDTYTQDSDTTDGSWSSLTSLSTTSGTATSNQTVRGAYKVVTGTTGAQTWNPTITSRDWAQLALVFDVAPAGGTTINGTASLAGTGAVTATVVQGAGGAPAGAGSLAATVVQQATATLTGAGTLTSPAVQSATATLAGAGALSADGAASGGGNATLTGAGTLSATATVTQRATATLTGAGTLSALATQGSTATLAGAGTLSATVIQRATATLAGAGTLVAVGTASGGGGAALVGAGVLSVSATQGATASLTGTGAATATVTQRTSATLTGTGAVAATVVQQATATLTGAGAVTASAISGPPTSPGYLTTIVTRAALDVSTTASAQPTTSSGSGALTTTTAGGG